MSEQLNLVGVTVPGLGPVQRAVLDELERLATLTSDEAGAVAHGRNGRHTRDERCKFCAIDGKAILSSLIRRGLAVKGAEGAVQLPRRTERGDT